MTIWQKAGWVVAICLALYVSVSSLLAPIGQQQPLGGVGDEAKQPNIIFIMSDDQDLHMDSLSYMPRLKKHMTDEGTFFRRHYCTVALCCPSRASLLTGKAAHNTNVTDINPPYGESNDIYEPLTDAYEMRGGYPKFVSQGLNEAYLPLWLQDAGYNTYYVGKLINGQTITNYNSPYAAGWTGSDFLLDPYTYRYLNATFQRNHELPRSYEGRYSTDVLAEKAYAFLDDAVAAQKPFFLGIAPTAPHSDVNIKDNLIDGNFSEHSVIQSPPIPAERHKHLFNDIVVPRTPHFNPDTPNSVSWISRLPQQNQTNVDSNDNFYRNRLRALQAVDELVEEVITRLITLNLLDNTYIFYTTDNGYHIGQHRLQPGKQCAFEEDINIPLMVRGPGIAKSVETDIITTHTDLAPTFLSLAGVELRGDFDGMPIPLLSPSQALPSRPHNDDEDDELSAKPHLNSRHKDQTPSQEIRPEHINVESWGIIMSEGHYGSHLYLNHTYKALRLIGPSYNLLYTIWCSGEHELYNLNNDPYELANLYATNHSLPFHFTMTSHRYDIDKTFAVDGGKRAEEGTEKATTLSHLTPRLDALIMVLKTCKAKQCTHPWESLHHNPSDNVSNLHDALREEYDRYYEEELDRVEFSKCEKGYILESEGKMWDESMGRGKRVYGMGEEMAYA